MFVLELSEEELSSLKEVVQMHNFPCEDCSPDLDCGVYQRGRCIAKNMADILRKLEKLN